MNIPDSLIFEGSKIRISFNRTEKLNSSSAAVVIEGTPNGFLSLSNCLIYLANSLQECIDVSELPFVSADVNFRLILDESVNDCAVGTVTTPDEINFTWTLSENDSNSVFTLMHSLAHLNLELHLDDGKTEGDISVYCVVIDS